MQKIDTTEFNLEIDAAVDVREKGDANKAIEMLSVVFKFTYDKYFDDVAARALGERIVCHKHLYELQGLEDSLNEMFKDIGLGFQLSISSHNQSVFWLRKGDYYTYKRNFAAAEQCCQNAYTGVNKGGSTEAEYLGHLAQAIANNSDVETQAGRDKLKTASTKIYKALKMVEGIPDKALEIKHRMIILSGLYMRLMNVHQMLGELTKVNMASERCFSLCKELEKRHNYPIRMQQLSKWYQHIGT